MQALGDKMQKLPHTEEIEKLIQGEEGVCVKVRIRLTQRLTLTRVGFSASLELENIGDDPLTNVQVSLHAIGTHVNYSTVSFIIVPFWIQVQSRVLFHLLQFFDNLSSLVRLSKWF